jgi:succinate dehydrogenase/fumarate reductase flavoprotein subunit
MGRYPPTAKGLASRDVVSRAMNMEINNRCRGWGPDRDSLHLQLSRLSLRSKTSLHSGVSVTKEAISVLLTVHYCTEEFPPIGRAKCWTSKTVKIRR